MPRLVPSDRKNNKRSETLMCNLGFNHEEKNGNIPGLFPKSKQPSQGKKACV